jgi:hypothetical protein
MHPVPGSRQPAWRGEGVELLSWLENTDTVTWIRESSSLLGYTLYLSLHTLGLVFLLGPVVIIGLRMAGLAPRLPIAGMRSFFPLMVAGFCVNLVSGLVLFATAPVGFVRNTTFLVKLASVLIAVVLLRAFLRHVFNSGANPETAFETRRARVLFGVSAVFWTLAITAGRLTAYSAYVVSRTVGALLVALVIALALVMVVRAVLRRRADEGHVPAALATPLKGE